MHLDARLKLNADIAKAPNLCDRLSAQDCSTIGGAVWDGYSHDKASRSIWERRMAAAMDLAMQVQIAKNFPWPGAANVVFPLVTIAALQFSARAYPAIIQGTDVVRYRVINQDPTGEMMKRADRIARHMSWQVLEEDESWEEQHDRLLINLSIVGSAFIKTYYSGSSYHNVSELVMARDLIIDYYAKSIEGAARISHCVPMYRNEIYERVMTGTFVDVRDEGWFGGPPPQPNVQNLSDHRLGIMPPPTDEEAAFHTIEQHRYLDLDGDGYAEPYIATIEKTSKKLLRLVARWENDEAVERNLSKEVIRIKPTHYFTKYSFIPSPDGGIYDLGFGAFLGPINEAVSTAINQLLDSGTFQNSIGGFLGRGVKIRGGVYTLAPWEFKRVDSTGDDLRKNIVPFPEKQPLAVTFQLIELLITYADRLAGTTETMVGENPGQNTPAETSRNMTEQGMQVFSMIFKRVWRSMKEEFEKLFTLNSMYMRDQMSFGSGKDFIRREDYSQNPDQIAPVANPNITSSTMRMSQAILVKQAAMTTNGYDRDEVERRFLRSAQVDNVDVIFPGAEQIGKNPKVQALPNPKLMVEQAKLQGVQMKIKAEQMKWANELMQERPKMMAEIDLLKAQASKVISEVGVERAGKTIEVFEMMINAYEAKNKANNDRIKALLTSAGEADGSTTNKGGVSGLDEPSGDSSLPPNASGGPPGSNGAMASGQLPI